MMLSFSQIGYQKSALRSIIKRDKPKKGTKPQRTERNDI